MRFARQHFFHTVTQVKLAAIPFAVLMALAGPAASWAEKPRISTINVSGSGSVSVAPDMALISFGVVSQAKTARAALDANNKAMADVLAAMQKLGIAEKDLQTSNFNISPRFHYPKRQSNGEQLPPVIIGYTVSNQLAVRVRDLAKTGEILDLAVTLGVNSGGNIRFTNDKPEAVLKEARIAAVKNARDKAQTLARELGAGLGRILDINESSNIPRPIPLGRAQLSVREADAAAVPVAAGENTYQVHVQISWEIDQ